MNECSTCQQANSPKSKFCISCGNKIEGSPKPDEQVAKTTTDDVIKLSAPEEEPSQINQTPAISHQPNSESSFSDHSPTFSLELLFNKHFVAGHPSVFRIKVTNKSHLPIENVAILVGSKNNNTFSSIDIYHLPPAYSEEERVQGSISSPGTHLLPIRVTYTQDSNPYYLQGVYEVDVKRVPISSNAQISIQQGIKNHQGGSVSDFEGSQEENVINIDRSAFSDTLNALLEENLTAGYRALRLRKCAPFSVHETDQSWNEPTFTLPVSHPLSPPIVEPTLSLSIPREWLAHHFPGNILDFKSGQNSEETPQIRVFATEVLPLGRAASDHSFWTHFLPPTKENIAKTMNLSRHHLSLSILDSKEILATDENTPKGSKIDEEAINKETPWDTHSEITLGGFYKIQLKSSHQETQTPIITNENQWFGPPNNNRSPLNGCTQIIPTNSTPPFEGVWLHSLAFFKLKDSHLLSASQQEADVGLIHHRNQFWFFTTKTSLNIIVNGQVLMPQNIIPLLDSQQIQISNTKLSVSIRHHS